MGSKTVRDMSTASILQEYYSSMLGMGDDAFQSKLSGLERSPEFGPIIAAIKKGESVQQYYYNEPLMLKMNRAVGGLPEDVKEKLSLIQKTPVTIHEACKMGDTKALE